MLLHANKLEIIKHVYLQKNDVFRDIFIGFIGSRRILFGGGGVCQCCSIPACVECVLKVRNAEG